MTIKLTSDGAAVVDTLNKWIKINSDSPRGSKLQLIDRKSGVAHCVGLNISEGVRRVNISNWSKFDSDGQPLRHQNGKIAKGPDYKEPDLEGLY